MKYRLRELAKTRTETLEIYIEKLTLDSKFKEVLMRPIKSCRDHKVSNRSKNFFHFIVFDDLNKDIARHIIEKSTKKGNAKKIAENMEREREKARIYLDSLKSYAVRRGK